MNKTGLTWDKIKGEKPSISGQIWVKKLNFNKELNIIDGK